jgi:hypothetical protein
VREQGVRHLLVGCRNQVTTWPCGKIADDRRFEIGFWFHGWTLSNLGLGVKIGPHAKWPNELAQSRPCGAGTSYGARCWAAIARQFIEATHSLMSNH